MVYTISGYSQAKCKYGAVDNDCKRVIESVQDQVHPSPDTGSRAKHAA